jgi:hypothetical protein
MDAYERLGYAGVDLSSPMRGEIGCMAAEDEGTHISAHDTSMPRFVLA